MESNSDAGWKETDPLITKARRAVIDQLRSQKKPAAAQKKLVARVKNNQWEATT